MNRCSETEVREALKYISADDRSTWIKVGMALKSGGYDVSLYDEWSATSEKYKTGEPLQKWNSFKKTGISIGTLFYLARQNGYIRTDHGRYIESYVSHHEAIDKPLAAEYVLPDLIAQVFQFHDALLENSERLHYLTEVRQIPIDIIKRYKIGFSQTGFNACFTDVGKISSNLSANYTTIFPFFDSEGAARYVIGEIEDRSKANANGEPLAKYCKPKDIPQPIFNSRYLQSDQKTLFVTEGIFDALSIEAVHYPCMAVLGTSYGAFTDDLERYQVPKDRIFIICLDSDETGRKAAQGLKASLDKLGYFSVIHHFTEKDANESWCMDQVSFCNEVNEVAESAQSQFLGWLSEKEIEMMDAEKTLETEVPDLMQFHRFDKFGNPAGVIDYSIFQYLTGKINMFCYGGFMYYYNNGVYIADRNGSFIKTEIKKCLVPELIRSPTIDRIHKLFPMEHSLQVTDVDLNNYPLHWINFKNGFYDPVEKRMIPHDPKYRSLNQIPYEYHPYKHTEGAEIDSMLNHVAPEADDREMLLQFCGYCMTHDTRQQKFLILLGIGGSGKSTLLSLLQHVVGERNVSNVPLDALGQKFKTYALVGKLLNSCADLKTTPLEDADTLKRISGEDPIDCEPKGKDSFSFKTYAKMIFSTNEMPLILNEKTNGFYRRLLILKVDQLPQKVRTDYQQALQAESEHFIHLCVDALERMYQNGRIVESAQSKEAVKNHRRDSDSVQAWLDECATLQADSKTSRKILKDSYQIYCYENDRTPMSVQNFYRAMKSKGFREVKNRGEWYFRGIALGRPAE